MVFSLKNIRFLFFILFVNHGLVSGYFSSQRLMRDQYGWSEWSAWGYCSRSCDIGIQRRDRVCYDLQNPKNKIPNFYCSGESSEFKVCVNQACPKDSMDFRVQQCERFNSRPYHGQFYKWKPFLDGAPLCNLLCIPDGLNTYQQLAEKVYDGTNCGYDYRGICINGECNNIGCDGNLNSTKDFDKCGVCGGDNESCRLVSGIYIDEPSEMGYHTITIFPRGARNINITEMEPSENFLSLKLENGTPVLNCDSKIEFSGVFNGAGTDIFYYRRRIILHKDIGEGIFIKGPITEPLVLQILYQIHNPGIMYHYVLDYEERIFPINSALANRHHNSDKSKPRGKLILLPANASLNDDLFWNKKPGNTNNLKNLPSIPSNAYLTDSLSYGNRHTKIISLFKNPELNTTTQQPFGIQHTSPITTQKPTTVLIRHRIHAKNNFISNERKPSYHQHLRRKNESEQVFILSKDSLNESNETYFWFVSGHTRCSMPCGEGIRFENIRCLNRSTGKIVEEEYCKLKPKPDAKNSTCNDFACPAKWYVSRWRECSVTCGVGVQYRGIRCRQRISARNTINVLKSMCNVEDLPDGTRECRRNCTYWKVGSWQRCSVSCGRGSKLRTVACVNENEQVVDESFCKESKPITYDKCDLGSCEVQNWLYNDWSSSCNSYCEHDRYITRRIVCGADTDITDDRPSLSYRELIGLNTLRCNRSKAPESKRKCSVSKHCIGLWFAGAWSECTVRCNQGNRTRNVVCMKKEADKWLQTENSYCSPSNKPPSIEKCNIQPCKPEWFYSDWGECSKTCGGGLKLREARCLDGNNQRSDECNLLAKPHVKEFCNEKDCPQSDTSGEIADPECKDTLSQCFLIYKSNLCDYYKKDCCRTCSK